MKKMKFLRIFGEYSSITNNTKEKNTFNNTNYLQIHNSNIIFANPFKIF